MTEIHADAETPEPRYAFDALAPGDLDDILALYTTVSASAPQGYLAARSREEFHAALHDDAGGVAVGARHENQLVAYSICRRAASIPYDPAPFLARIDAAHSCVYLGMGTVVHPSHEGRMLMARLMALRGDVLRQRAADHVLGLVAIDNLASVASVLRAGALLVGLSRDATAMNYVGYAGRLRALISAGAPTTPVTPADMPAQHSAFAAGRVINAMRRDADGQRAFDFVPVSADKHCD